VFVYSLLNFTILKSKVFPLPTHQAVKLYGVVEVKFHTSLISASVVSGQIQFPIFSSKETAPGYHWIGEQVCYNTGLDAVVKRKREKSMLLAGNESQSSNILIVISAPQVSGINNPTTINIFINCCFFRSLVIVHLINLK